jgi:acyl carrier protein
LYGDLKEDEILLALELKHRYAMTKEEAKVALAYALHTSYDGHLIVSTGHLPSRLSPQPPSDSSANANKVNDTRALQYNQRPNLKSAFVEPRNEIEVSLSAIWREFLGIDRIGVHDDFFELGGHSLLATKLVARVRTTFGIDLPLVKLFESPTVAQMGSLVASSVEHAHS